AMAAGGSKAVVYAAVGGDLAIAATKFAAANATLLPAWQIHGELTSYSPGDTSDPTPCWPLLTRRCPPRPGPLGVASHFSMGGCPHSAGRAGREAVPEQQPFPPVHSPQVRVAGRDRVLLPRPGSDDERA